MTTEAKRTVTRTVRHGPDGDTVALPGLRVVVARGPDKGRACAVDREELVIGTSAGCELQLTDPTVSRHHLALRATDHGLLAVDLDSTNGTFVERRRIRAAWIAAGEKLDLGATRLRLETTRQQAALPLSSAQRFGHALGRSAAMRRLFAVLEDVAASDATVLFSGETGTGKDLLAEALHEASPRRHGPFIVVDCSALADGLVESELFGHEKGAFTGADRARRGAIAAAHGGTLLIDEIGELPRALQPKLLRVLERREVRPLGSNRAVAVDARIVAATNRDLRLDVNRGLFREDLFYRLNVVSLRVPPLRERVDDVELLAHHFWRELSGDADAHCPAELLQLFVKHRWPGNVRELRNRIERALLLPGGAYELTGVRADAPPSYGDARESVLAEFEQRFLGELMLRAGGNVSEAARLARMDRVYLSKLLRKHGLR